MRADLRGDRERHITICVRERKNPNQDQKLMRAQICAPSSALCARVNMSKIVIVTNYNQGDAENGQDIAEKRPEDRT